MGEPRIRVDPHDPTPAYEQVRRGVRDLIATGALRAGDRLPALRQLAGDLGLAVGTVARAYAELEEEGLLVSRRGAGTRVAQTVPAPREEVLDHLAADYLERARAIGVPDHVALEAVRERVTAQAHPPR